MPEAKLKGNIHKTLVQKLSEANEYIDLSDLYMPWKLNLLYVHDHFRFSCNLFHFTMNFCYFFVLFSLSDFYFIFSFVSYFNEL